MTTCDIILKQLDEWILDEKKATEDYLKFSRGIPELQKALFVSLSVDENKHREMLEAVRKEVQRECRK